jgi:hypothetical protein
VTTGVRSVALETAVKKLHCQDGTNDGTPVGKIEAEIRTNQAKIDANQAEMKAGQAKMDANLWEVR